MSRRVDELCANDLRDVPGSRHTFIRLTSQSPSPGVPMGVKTVVDVQVPKDSGGSPSC